ncbi:MAG: class I SAM-dependent methyltransferase [Acidimicrobiia bacterium]|nr:class I SAM-dependent methyltransferase [Acidimicrobiia bacterium]MYE72324.1 class I SAM-dependent methyltransferase [Acidimicrobiia bacterium]MYJ62458.1 class I SAM-dependent methyltransferase [Acidimicrobiia bacterium]
MAAATNPNTPAIESRLAESIRSYDQNVHSYIGRYQDIDYREFRQQLLGSLDYPPRSLLDVGCGTGRDAKAFNASIPNVIGIDLSYGLLSAAKGIARQAHFIHADMRKLPICSASIDVVWSMASLVHLDSEGTILALREMGRVLRPGGSLFVSVPSGIGSEWREDGLGGRRWFYYFQPSQFLRLANNIGFTIEWTDTGPGVTRGQWTTLIARPVSLG